MRIVECSSSQILLVIPDNTDLWDRLAVAAVDTARRAVEIRPAKRSLMSKVRAAVSRRKLA